jgi:preprotein translocase subunit SecB
MARKSKSKNPHDEIAATASSQPTAALPLRLLSVALRELSYRELPFDPAKLVPDQVRMNIGLQLQVQLRFLNSSNAEIRLNASVKPDPTVKPIEISVSMSAVFERSPEMGPREFARVVHDVGARILYPYVREVCSNVTNRGIFGAMHLDPMVVATPLSEEQLARFPETD